MSNHITIELCAEDRARIDRLAAALEALQPQTIHVDDPIQKALAEQVAKSEKTPTQSPVESAGEAKTETPATPQPEAETTAVEEPAPVAEEKPAPTTAELQQKVIALVDKGKKAEVAAIVKSYAATVSSIPEDKRAECMDKLNALED
jgi:hypothetical protein